MSLTTTQKSELTSFHYAFQLSKTHIFEVNYYRLGNNQDKHFSTSAAIFNRPKTDWNSCGQAQKRVLPQFPTAKRFYEKWDKLHIKDLTPTEHAEILADLEGLKNTYNHIYSQDHDINFSEIRELSKQTEKRFVKEKPAPGPNSKRLSPEQKEARKLERQEAKKAAKEAARIESEKNQKEVKEIKISIEWRKSKMWGHNPFLDASIWFKDGSYESFNATASGCGYDKESTVIADVFNAFLKYKLYRPLVKTDRDRSDQGHPYGIYLNPDHKYYSGGIGTNCYYPISEAIGGKFEHVASGKSYDAYKYTDNI